MILPYVYILIDRITGQFYIGYRYKNVRLQLNSSDDLGVVYFTSCKHISKNNFLRFDALILAEFFDRKDAYWFEQQLIKDNKKNPLMINRHYQDPNSKVKEFVNFCHSEETIEKMTGLKRSDSFREYRRQVMTGNVPWNVGLSKDSDPRMAKLAKKRKAHGNPHQIGQKHSAERIEKVKAALTGRSMTAEECAKMSAAKKGKSWEEIFGIHGARLRREAMKKTMGGNHSNAKAIVTPAGKFNAISEATKYYKMSDNAIRNRCKNPNFTGWYYEQAGMEDVTI